MPKLATKAADNVFYLRRLGASKSDDRLNSRDDAAKMLGMSRTRLAYIELDRVRPHPEEILLMSEVYHAPELCNHFCSRLCPLGVKTVPAVEVLELEKIVLRLLSVFRSLPEIQDNLIDVAADGIIDGDEAPAMKIIVDKLMQASNDIQALKLIVEKSAKSRNQ